MSNEANIDTPEERRALEFHAFAKVTGRLNEAADGVAQGNAWRQALETNRVFWGMLRENLFASDNRLTPDLKGQIYSLANWVEGYTDKVLSGETKEIRPLIAINDTIMQGLAA